MEGLKTHVDAEDYEHLLNERRSYEKLMELFAEDATLQTIAADAPGLMQHIKKYEGTLSRGIDVCEWNPDANPYSCGDLSAYDKVARRKKEIWNQIAKYKGSKTWDALAPQKKEDFIDGV